MHAIVITTIQEPTASVRMLRKETEQYSSQMLIIGDKKGPFSWDMENSDFFSIQDQADLPFQLAKLLPTGSYSRKNLGYLEAIRRSASSIFETDDDNAPMSNWKPREISCSAREVKSDGWVNAYRFFTEERIWPRGFPISKIRESNDVSPPTLGQVQSIQAPIQQALASGSPDVDAIWRLVMDREVHFNQEDSVFLPEGNWCPFNSQSTWWFPEAFHLMYLPSFVSFRMTDIWRGFVAQRCLWEMGYGLVFHGPEMFQDRNPHNLVSDFQQELPGYLGNENICEKLYSLQLSKSDPLENLLRCYEALVAIDVVPERELELVELWINDLKLLC